MTKLPSTKRPLTSQLLDDWSTNKFSMNRERINHWLLQRLYSDENLARVRILMLAEPPLKHIIWAQQTPKYWFLDGAAIDAEFRPVGSVSSLSYMDALGRAVDWKTVDACSLPGFDFILTIEFTSYPPCLVPLSLFRRSHRLLHLWVLFDT